MNWSAAEVAVVPSVLETTVTSTVPADPAGDVAVICVRLSRVKTAVADPNFTADRLTKRVPVITTVVPPAVEPDVGEIEVTAIGAGAIVNDSDALPE